jgi:hypothetical protein
MAAKSAGRTNTKAVPTSKKKVKTKRRVRPQINGTCFVLMPFKEPFNSYYDSIIRPAVESVRLSPVRGDSLFRPSPIMGDIWQSIQDAKVLVAELTEKNANVFYELGLAHAIGKPVILISETMDDVPFDLQPLRVLIYDKDDPAWGNKLKTHIVSALAETLPNAIEVVPPMFRKRVKSQAPEDSELSLRMSQLERQFASILERDRSDDSQLDLIGDTEMRLTPDVLRHVRNRQDAIDKTKRLLEAGVRVNAIREALTKFISSEEANHVLKSAMLGPRPLAPRSVGSARHSGKPQVRRQTSANK